jgi:hypothetical protein
MNGSSKDIAKLHTVARSLTDNEAIGLLPVFYANLDLSWIPSLNVLDNIADLSARLPCIENATKNTLFPLLHSTQSAVSSCRYTRPLAPNLEMDGILPFILRIRSSAPRF